MTDRPGDTFEHLNGALHHVEDLVGSSEDLNGNIFLENFNDRLLMIDDIAATSIVSEDKLWCTVLCTVSGECNLNICLLCVLHEIKRDIFGDDTNSH